VWVTGAALLLPIIGVRGAGAALIAGSAVDMLILGTAALSLRSLLEATAVPLGLATIASTVGASVAVSTRTPLGAAAAFGIAIVIYGSGVFLFRRKLAPDIKLFVASLRLKPITSSVPTIEGV
jgi:hypothetical protein